MREVVKTCVPKSLRYHAKNAYRYLRTLAARKAFYQASSTPEWLGPDMLQTLNDSYSHPPLISYDPKDLQAAAERRANACLSLIGKGAAALHRILDIGCSEGSVCVALSQLGKSAAGIDIRKDFRRDRATAVFAQMDALRLGFKNESFDLVLSLASFEHFSDPESVLDEAIRVVRKGGYIYLHFGPLYMSSYGLHAYRSLTVPFCQLLFQERTLVTFCRERNLTPPDFGSLNKWSLEDYRRLWDRYASRLRRIRHFEYLDSGHVDLIARFSSCFRSKTDCFDNLIVPEVEVLFQKL
jgi:SAM-dependent methyltransferase